MAINTKYQIDASFHERWMTVKQLKIILETLDENAELSPNQTGNLLVWSDDKDAHIGVINFATETFEAFEETHQTGPPSDPSKE